MTNESTAKDIAEYINECRYRSDSFEKDIYNLVLKHLQAAYRRGHAAADANPWQPESMGR